MHAATLTKRHDRAGIFRPAVLIGPSPTLRRYVLCLRLAVVGFVRLDNLAFAAHRGTKATGSHALANAVRHEPCRAVGDAEFSLDLERTDTLLAAGHEVDRDEPQSEGELAILKNGPDTDREAVATLSALNG